MYRGTWLLVALPLLVAAFSVSRTQPLPPPSLPPAFDARSARELADDLSKNYPNRFPGSAGALGAANWFESVLAPYGLPVQRDRFSAVIPGFGKTTLENLLAVVPGKSPQTIVVMAHRDDLGVGSGADDNASGTAALVELARAYASSGAGASASCGTQRVCPSHTIVFLSTDGGAFGGFGAERFARTWPQRRNLLAVLNLDAVNGAGRIRLEIAGDVPRSPAASLVATVAARVLDQTRAPPARPTMVRQLVDLGFPFSLTEQAPFVARGVPAVTMTRTPERPAQPYADIPSTLSAARIGDAGRAAQQTLASVDAGLEIARGTSSYLYLGARQIRGWAVELVLIAALFPFLAAVVDLFARCRRRRIALAPGLRSYRSRLGFWLFGGALFGIFALLNAWPAGSSRPLAPETDAARNWPVTWLALFGLLLVPAWLLARDRLTPRRSVIAEEELAGTTAALLVLAVVALLVVATNPFALVFVLPSLHAWLWLPQVRAQARTTQIAVLLAGFAGPLLLLASLGSRLHLGLDTPWYLAELAAVGYVPITMIVIALGWSAAAAQLVAVTAGRYAPYPAAGERPRLGPGRRLVRRVVLSARSRQRESPAAEQALEG
jgi:Peptidase family M28